MSPTITTRKEEELARKVRERLSWDGAIDAAHITIAVDGDIVILKGSVPSYMERQHAEIDVMHVPGVRNVINRLTLSYPGKAAASADNELAGKIRASLAGNTGTAGENIRVSARSQVICLDGTVKSYGKKLKAAELAADTPGVLDVQNRLVIASGGAGDKRLAAAVIKAIQEQTKIDLNAVDIEVRDGTIIVSGSFPNHSQHRTLEKILNELPGATSVENEAIIL